MTNAVTHIASHAEQRPDHVALREGERSWTYAELAAGVQAAAEELRGRGVGAGDRVLVVAPTCAEFALVYHGLLAIGAVAVTVNPLCTSRELDYFVEDSGASYAIGWAEAGAATAEAAQTAGIGLWQLEPGCVGSSGAPLELADVADDDAAVLLYTSGTTGRPKGAVLTHANVAAAGRTLMTTLNLVPEDRMGTALPLFHVFGQCAVMGLCFTAGATLALLRPFSGAALLALAREHRLTGLAGVPTMWNAMLHAETDVTAEDLADLRLACSGGAALPLEIAKAFKARFGATVLDGYGLSETSAVSSFNREGNPRKELSVGRAVDECELTILDQDRNPVAPGETGEVAVAGPVIMREYWNRPEATAEVRVGKWFLTGDIGRMDEDGDLWIVDRAKDLIIRGGYNVYPREVEEVLYTHPQVLEAAVVGIPDQHLGEEVAAIIAPNPGEQVDPEALRAWLGERVAAYKVPRIYQVVAELPKGPTGKILKRSIDRDEVASTGARPARRTS